MVKLTRLMQLANMMPAHPAMLSWISQQLNKPARLLKLTDLQELYSRKMSIDPRTLKPVAVAVDCHLIPQMFGISNRVLPLEGQIDHEIGDTCDSELKKYLDACLAKQLPGRIAMAGGSTSLRGVFDVVKQEFRIPTGRKTRNNIFEERALGAKDGEATLIEFRGEDADGHLAAMSAIHSGLLILHYLGHMEVYGSAFDVIRELIQAATDGSFGEAHRNYVEASVGFNFPVRREAVGTSAPQISDLRGLVDDTLNDVDGLEAAFPFKCVQETETSFILTLPYPNSVRGRVMFLKRLID